MSSAAIRSALATCTLLIGMVLAYRNAVGPKWTGLIMAFGVGAIISAAVYQLVLRPLMEVKANVYVVFLGLAAGALTLYLADRWVDHIAVAARPAAGNVLLRNENLVLAEHRLGRKVTVVGQPAPAPQVDGDVLPAASVLEQVLPGIVRFVMPGDKAE